MCAPVFVLLLVLYDVVFWPYNLLNNLSKFAARVACPRGARLSRRFVYLLGVVLSGRCRRAE